MEKRTTPLGQSYWGNTGAYQEENDRLWEELVPSSGECKTLRGELVRSVGRLFYEYCNNGNCNAVEWQEERCNHCGGDGSVHVGYDRDEEEDQYDDCSWCDGSGNSEGEPEITEFYEGFLDLIELNVPEAPVGSLRDFMLEGHCGFGDAEMQIYNDVTDAVMHWVLTNEDRPYPVK